MAKATLIIGESGSGKTASLRNFKEGEVLVISVAGKDMPFRCRWPKYIVHSKDYDFIKNYLKAASARPKCPKVVVIDDSQYLMAFQEMDQVNVKGYDKFTQIASDFYRLLVFMQDELPADFTVYYLHHSEKSDDGYVSPKTIGKMLSNHLKVEGMFNIVMMATVKDGKHVFLTHNNDGMSCVKTPIGMFEEDYVDNDLKLVDATIRDYYGMGITTDKEEKNGEQD